jgi:hypothetical protein
MSNLNLLQTFRSLFGLPFIFPLIAMFSVKGIQQTLAKTNANFSTFQFFDCIL